ncbi:MAG: hypothetical protein PHS62_03485 [Patescibacteria group bacterium]|nr:hypothetical protein [Patescibacteria group bacterium]
MKITICGSVKFADKIVAIHQQLKALGHEPQIHPDMFGIANGTAKELIDAKQSGEHHLVKIKYNFIKAWHNLIINSDAVLICNFDKNGIKNYIGGNTLMEIGFAHVNNKKIFLLNPIPENVSYVDEIKAMVDVILNGDLTKIV